MGLMSWNVQRKQSVSFIILLGIVALLTTFAFRIVKRDVILFRKAEGFFQAKEFSKAIPFYQAALGTGIKFPSALSHLGDSYQAMGNFKEALQTYEKIVRANPLNLPAVKSLAVLYEQFGRWDEAIALYQVVLQAYPNHRLARIYLARALSSKGRFEEAIREYRKALGETT